MARTVAAKAREGDRILTLHPAGKNGVRIERAKYDEMRRAILKCVPRGESGIALSALTARVPRLLDRSIFPPGTGLTWYLIAVKQDLEARGQIAQVAGRKPQHLRRAAMTGRI